MRKLWVLKDLAHPQAQEAETRNVYDMLRASKSASLFPNLNFVQMQLVPSIMTLRLLHVVASPSLQEIDISLRNRSRYGSNEGSDPGVPKLMEELSAFCESCPSVKTLHLTASTKVVDLRALSKTLQACRDLRSVVLMVHDPRRHPACPSDTTVDGVRQLLSQLSSLPWLHELNLTPGQFDHHQDGQTVGLSVPLAFQDLVIVNLRGVNDSFLKSLLRDCLFPSLGSLRVDVTHAIFPTFAGLLKASVSTETFHTLEVDLPRTVAPFPVFGWPELRPLLSFHNLESLSMSGRAVSLEVSDQYWEVFARSWPRLRRLHIGDSLRDDGSIGVNPSFTSLVHLVRNCPKLSSVTLTLRDNSDHIIDFAELDALPVSEHLTELHLRHTSFRHLGPPAAWIARMFPRLAMLTKAEQFSDESMVGIFGNFSTAQWDELFDAVRAAAAGASSNSCMRTLSFDSCLQATSANEPFPAGAKLC